MGIIDYRESSLWSCSISARVCQAYAKIGPVTDVREMCNLSARFTVKGATMCTTPPNFAQSSDEFDARSYYNFVKNQLIK